MSRYRKSRLLKLDSRILIICEGQSECQYFITFKKLLHDKYKLKGLEVEIYQPKYYSPMGLLKEAKKKIREAKADKLPYDKVWIVFDKDQHQNIHQVISESTGHKQKIEVGLSIISFEIWILLHFEKTKKPFHSCEELVRYLETHHIPFYKKTMSFNTIISNKINFALENAEWLEQQNSLDINNGVNIADLSIYTNINKIIEHLISLK